MRLVARVLFVAIGGAVLVMFAALAARADGTRGVSEIRLASAEERDRSRRSRQPSSNRHWN